jgi:hypothetical protein
MQMAQRGAPPGNRNAVKNRPFADAIQRALARAEAKGDFCTLNAIAEKLLAMAGDGDLEAIKLLADRLDGKPMAAVDVTTRRAESLNEEQARNLAEAFIESSRRAAAREGEQSPGSAAPSP